VFGNVDDTEEGITSALKEHFDNVKQVLWVLYCCLELRV
jgi:hypothetical protein